MNGAIPSSNLVTGKIRERAAHVLATSTRKLSPSPEHDRLTTIAAWSLAHCFAGLRLNGALPETAHEDPEALARNMIRLFFDDAL
ncbi:hypothetical protein ACFMQL_37500 [Nonomuraea fastidiosa]|jgi:hypothetical protein|uniref:hypothetical protein n=1 Tax=Nonomuraea TaxID=83681 RepID=UPI00342EAD73